MSSDTAKFKILVTDADYAPVILQVLADFPEVEVVCPQTGEDLSAAASGHFDGIITQFAPVDETLLQKVSDLKAIVKMGRNYYNVDLNAVRSRGLVLGSAPRKGPNCVAELAMTFILALSKDMIITHESVAQGAYRLRGLKPTRTEQRKFAFHWMKNERVHEVRRKTLGIIGLGEIGCELAIRAAAMGMYVIYHDQTRMLPEIEQRYGVTYREFDDLIKESDYISLHIPLTPQSEKLIGKKQFDMMKPTAYIVNTCRGPVIDEEALIEALENDRIAGAGLDVFTYEPLQAESPLCMLDNVIMTTHIGGGTGTTKQLEISEALEEMLHILKTGQPHINLS